MEILKSNKGGSKLCFEGYMYTRHALRKTKQWWKCTMKSSRGCRGSLSTDLQHNNPVPGQPHNHSPEESSVNLTRLRNNMQEKALSTHNAPNQIFAECVSTTSNAVKSMLPAEENCKRTIRRHRPQLPSPSSLKQLTIPPEFAVTLDEDLQPFLFYDNGPDARTRVIAFATEDNLRHLATADTLYMDGTFDTAPPLLKQIFTIRVPFGNTHITLCTAFYRRRHVKHMMNSSKQSSTVQQPGHSSQHHQSGHRLRRWSTTCNFSSVWSSSWSPGLFLPFNAGYLAQNTETPTSHPLHDWSRISPVLQHTRCLSLYSYSRPARGHSIHPVHHSRWASRVRRPGRLLWHYICKWYLPSSPAAESRPTSTTDTAPCSTYVPAFSLECPQCYNGG